MRERPTNPDLVAAVASLSSPASLDEAHSRLIASAAPVMIWACDAYGGYTFFNDQWAKFTGLSRETLLDDPWRMDIPAGDRPRYRQRFLAAFHARKELLVEYRLRRHDGAYRWLLDTGVPVHDARGTFLGYVGNCVDITERRLMEEALAESERKFKLLFDRSADAQVLLDDERVVDCNDATVSLFMLPDRWALVGRPTLKSLPDGDADLLLGKIREARNGTSQRFEWLAQRSDRTDLPLEVLLTGIPLGDRVLVHATLRDLSAQHALEQRLRQSQKMEAIGTLAGGIAHDFNNLLGVIMGYAELTRMELRASGVDAGPNLEEALRAARRARDLVQQILTFSRADATPRREVDLAALVEESARLLRASIPSTVALEVRADPDCVVVASAMQIQQVLINLGSNAEHAMRATLGGTLTITVSSETFDEAAARASPPLAPGLVARVVVRDTGVGMEPRVLERAFDPFFTTKPVGEGTGMGLAVVHGIVSSHGGAISIDSEPGRGTAVTLLLPRVDRRALETRGSTHPTGLATTTARGRVLVVEDEAALGKVFRRMLTTMGYTVSLFERGAEALEAFRADPTSWQAVVTDLTMPGMTGDVLCAEVRALRGDIPVILVTGYSLALGEERLREAGVTAVLRKPLTYADLSLALLGAQEPTA